MPTLAKLTAAGLVPSLTANKLPKNGNKGLPVCHQFLISHGKNGMSVSAPMQKISQLTAEILFLGGVTIARANSSAIKSAATKPLGFVARAKPNLQAASTNPLS